MLVLCNLTKIWVESGGSILFIIVEVVGIRREDHVFGYVFAGLPPRYRDSVRQITPGLPLFLYNYSTHQLHGIYEVSHGFQSIYFGNFVGVVGYDL